MPPSKENINGEHGVMIKLMESYHKDNQNVAKIQSSHIKTLFKKFDDLSTAFYSFKLNAPCKAHAVEFENMKTQAAGRTGWRMLVVTCLIGVFGLLCSAIWQASELNTTQKFLTDKIIAIEKHIESEVQ